jgi:hypothetical protein
MQEIVKREIRASVMRDDCVKEFPGWLEGCKYVWHEIVARSGVRKHYGMGS